MFQRSQGIADHVRPAIGPINYAPGERAQFTLQIIDVPGSPLAMRTSLFRDGAEVYEGPAAPVETGAPTAGRAFTHGVIDIPGGLQPGDYTMRVQVEDRLATPNHATAWQWARFSVGGPQK